MALGWLRWRAWAGVAGVAAAAVGVRRGCWRGRRGTLRHPPWQASHATQLVHTQLVITQLLIITRVAGNLSTQLVHTQLVHNRGTYGIGLLGWLRWRAWAGVAGVAAAAVGVAGVALCDIHLGFTWQAWHLVTSTSSLCVAGVAGVARMAWQAWQAWHFETSTLIRFTWQAWYLVTWTFTLCGRRGTYGIGLAPVARLGRSGRGGRRGCWRGRRGTLRHPPWFHVAGVVLGDIDLHFVWQAWQAWHVWHFATATLVSRGRRGTWRPPHSVFITPMPRLRSWKK